MKLKGWKKLGKTINKLGKKIEKKLTYKLSSVDQSDPCVKKVYFGILRDLDNDVIFIDNLYKVHPDAPKLTAYMYALLHEIGHYHTKEVLDNEPNEARKNINVAGDNSAYFLLPSEIAATAWAVQYAKTHFDFITALQEKIEDALDVFILKNNLCE